MNSLADLHDQGYALVPSALTPDTVATLRRELQPLLDAHGSPAGVRNLLDVPLVCDLSRSAPARTVAEAVLGRDCIAVRGILFDKTPGANWMVTWHQDCIIAVAEQRDTPGYTAWSEKAGVAHVQPPDEVLRSMLALRLHLDDCGPDNGPLRVLPGSHSRDLTPAEIATWIERVTPVTCVARAGDILAFRPLLLHASSPAASPHHRRVLHIEFAAGPLPGGLRWRWAVGRESTGQTGEPR
jgi:hypothetical protein